MVMPEELERTETKATKNAGNKVLIRIPVDKQNEKDLSVEVCINGNIIQIKRGEDIYVTPQVRKILIEAKYL